jgi:hypothetical protein
MRQIQNRGRFPGAARRCLVWVASESIPAAAVGAPACEFFRRFSGHLGEGREWLWAIFRGG